MKVRDLKIYNLIKDDETLFSGTIDEIANEFKVQRKTVVKWKRENSYEFRETGKDQYIKKEFACYEDDTFITIGTLHEIADYLGITYGTLITYRSKKMKYIFVEV